MAETNDVPTDGMWEALLPHIDDESARTAVVSGEVDWSAGGRVHNWRNHVPDVLRSHWSSLSLETRAAVCVFAREDADAEEWE